MEYQKIYEEHINKSENSLLKKTNDIARKINIWTNKNLSIDDLIKQHCFTFDEIEKKQNSLKKKDIKLKEKVLNLKKKLKDILPKLNSIKIYEKYQTMLNSFKKIRINN